MNGTAYKELRRFKSGSLKRLAARIGYAYTNEWTCEVEHLMYEHPYWCEKVVNGLFRLSVDYRTLPDRAVAAGRYDRKDADFSTKYFPMKGTGIVELEAKYFHFNVAMLSGEVVRTIKGRSRIYRRNPFINHWRPAKIEHLLALGSTYPIEQYRYAIIALGSIAKVDGQYSVPMLNRSFGERIVRLRTWHRGWAEDTRFLAVRDIQMDSHE